MRVIYHSYSGRHFALTAAAIHLGWLPARHRADPTQVKAMWARGPKVGSGGALASVGHDDGGNEVMVLARRWYQGVAERALRGMAEIHGIDPADLLFVNACPQSVWPRSLAALAGAPLSPPAWGDPWITSVMAAYPFLAALAQETQRLARGSAKAARRRLLAATTGKLSAQNPGHHESKEGRSGEVRVFYHCYGSAHTSVVSAAIHLGLLPNGRPPRSDRLADIGLFDRVDTRLVGTPLFMGVDDEGHEVYVLGLAGAKGELLPAFTTLLGRHGGDIFVDSLVLATPAMKMGGLLSRRLGLITVGRSMVSLAVIQHYGAFCDLVANTRQKLRGLVGQPNIGQ